MKTISDQANEIATGVGGATSTQTLQADAAQVTQLIQQAVDVLNAKDGNQYLFGGTASGQPPYSVTTDAGGAPCCGQQWDTVVGQDPLPHIGSGFDGVGQSTWVLGVMEKKALVNDANGRVFLGPGKHAVLLGGNPSGYFNPGQHFRLLVHHPGAPEWGGSPVFVW